MPRHGRPKRTPRASEKPRETLKRLCKIPKARKRGKATPRKEKDETTREELTGSILLGILCAGVGVVSACPNVNDPIPRRNYGEVCSLSGPLNRSRACASSLSSSCLFSQWPLQDNVWLGLFGLAPAAQDLAWQQQNRAEFEQCFPLRLTDRKFEGAALRIGVALDSVENKISLTNSSQGF